MDKKKLREFLKAPEQNAGHWVQSTVLRSGLAVERLASLLNRKPDIVYKWLNPQDHERNFPLCYLPQLLEESGDLTIIDDLNCMFGRICIEHTGDLAADLRSFLAEWEAMQRKAEG